MTRGVMAHLASRQEASRLLEAEAVDVCTASQAVGARRRVRVAVLAALAVACMSAIVCASAVAALRAPAYGDLSGLAGAWGATAIDATNLIAAETRWTARVSSVVGGHGRHFVNYAAGMQWVDFRTKIDAWLAGARERAAANGDGIIILADTDIVDGGCSDAQIFDRYQRIVQASGGAPIVTGVDINQYPRMSGAIERFMAADLQARRAAVLAEFGMNKEVFKQWQIYLDKFNSYSFVNSGFIIGPAALVVKTLECVQVFGWFDGRRRFDDQIGLARCAARHVDKITLDYTGGLVITVHAFKVGFLAALPAGIRNSMLGDTQCFVHVNGYRTPETQQWLQWYQGLGYPEFGQQVL